MDKDDILDLLKQECERVGTRKVASDAGTSVAYVSDVVRYGKSVSDKLARALGYRRVVRFERIDTDA